MQDDEITAVEIARLAGGAVVPEALNSLSSSGPILIEYRKRFRILRCDDAKPQPPKALTRPIGATSLAEPRAILGAGPLGCLLALGVKVSDMILNLEFWDCLFASIQKDKRREASH